MIKLPDVFLYFIYFFFSSMEIVFQRRSDSLGTGSSEQPNHWIGNMSRGSSAARAEPQPLLIPITHQFQARRVLSQHPWVPSSLRRMLGAPGRHPHVPKKPLWCHAAARRRLLLKGKVSASSFGGVHTPHRSEGNCHLLL